MKVIIIAAIAQNGVVGRTSKSCPSCEGSGRGCYNGDYSGWGVCWNCNSPEERRERNQLPSDRWKMPTGQVPANDLPWGNAYPQIPEHTYAITMEHAVIAGRVTWGVQKRDARPCDARVACPDCDGRGCSWIAGERRVVVVSASLHYSTSHTGGTYGLAKDLPHALGQLQRDRYSTVFIIGGPRLWRDALPLADELDLTLIGRAWEGDVLFPCDLNRDDSGLDRPVLVFVKDGVQRFACISREPCPTNLELTFTRWVRRA